MTHGIWLWAAVMDAVCESSAPLKIDVVVHSLSAARDLGVKPFAGATVRGDNDYSWSSNSVATKAS